MRAECAIAFELLFVEELVGSRLAGEFRMVVGVLLDIGWLIPGHGSADVDQDAWRRVGVDVVITYLADDHMSAR